MIKLGYSLGVGPEPKYSLKERIKILASVEKRAVELGYVVADRLKEELDSEDVRGIREFEFVAVHAPAVVSEGGDEKEWVRYPSSEAEAPLEKISEIAERVNADAVLFHPDLVDDFGWLGEKIGERLAFENMDAKKDFGKSIADMEKVFSEAPEAKWVCDVNHVYTLDRSMGLAKDFHAAFGERLCYYHLSGYGGFHDSLCISREDVILEGIRDFSVPIIDEGRALRDGRESLVRENDYVLERIGGREGGDV